MKQNEKIGEIANLCFTCEKQNTCEQAKLNMYDGYGKEREPKDYQEVMSCSKYERVV